MKKEKMGKIKRRRAFRTRGEDRKERASHSPYPKIARDPCKQQHGGARARLFSAVAQPRAAWWLLAHALTLSVSF